MADDFEAAKKSLDVLGEVFQLTTSFADVSKFITLSGTLASVFPVVGAVLGLIGGFLPDAKHNEILRRFDQLDNKIDRLRGDMENLKNVIRWDITELQYADHVDRIQFGMKFCLEIGKSRDQAKRKQYQDRLKDLCANGRCTLSVNAILEGTIENGNFRTTSILDKYYDKTGGNRPQTSALGTRLLQVLCEGMMVISTYETMLYGKKGAADITKLFYPRLKDAFNKVKSVLDRCVKDFSGNMLNDLNKKLDEGGSNKDLVAKISALMRDKYDWLENYCLVYNDLKRFGETSFGGSVVSSLHRNGKFGVVFYRTKGEAPKFSNRYDEAYKIVQDVRPCDQAKNCYNNIAAKIKARGIQSTGCMVIKGNPDLWTAGNFSTKIILVNKSYRLVAFFYSYRDINVKVILLLK